MEEKHKIEIKFDYPPKLVLSYFGHVLKEVKRIVVKEIPKMFKTKNCGALPILFDDSMVYIDETARETNGGDHELEYDILNNVKQILVDQDISPDLVHDTSVVNTVEFCRIKIYHTIIPMLYLVEVEKEGKKYGKSFSAHLEIQL